MSDLRDTPLSEMHRALGATMTGFAGYAVPLHFGADAADEHRHTRAAAGLFDLSPMGQVLIRHEAGYGAAARALERMVPASLLGLGEKRQRYGLLTDENGGIVSDMMVTNRGDHLLVTVDAGSRASAIAMMQAGLPECEVVEVKDRAFLAVQGPRAVEALAPIAAGCEIMTFLDTGIFTSDFGELWVSRAGFTGEDGYEVSVPAAQAEALASALRAHEAVQPVGAAARDSLRIEAGLCRHGQEIDATTTPVEAGLSWAIQSARRRGGDREGGFPGAGVILDQLENGVARCRVGLRPEGQEPMRRGTGIFDSETGGVAVGTVTSGVFGPTLGAPVSMGYVSASHAGLGTRLWGEVAGQRRPVTVAALPFSPANVKRRKSGARG